MYYKLTLDKMLKRDKWRFLTTMVGYDKYTVPIYEASARNKCVPLLKTLMSSYCMNNCKFCAFRAERKTIRERWTPEELAKVTLKMWKEGKIQGLFLSSSVEKDPNLVVEREIRTVEILRENGFTAYCHLRIMPSTDRELIKRSVEIADRVGINIEFPRKGYYDDMKIFLDFRQDLIRRIKWLSHEIQKAQKEGKCKAGLDTQMIVGASNETDKEILEMTDWLYHKLKARRVYFSAFEPIKNTPLENKVSENKWREYRLYQSSFLLQKYGFHVKDFVFHEDMLQLNYDPKFLIANQSGLFVDINDAEFKELIKVPGIGIETAKKIASLRNSGVRFRSIKQLKKVGVIAARALPFIKLGSSFQKRLNSFLLTSRNINNYNSLS
jgi:predicted DNA-binding helix-hairpin-helix protein